jgi:hypothetical protein
MYYRSGLWGLVVLIADIWAIVNILQSGADTGKKVLWTVLYPVVLPGSENWEKLIDSSRAADSAGDGPSRESHRLLFVGRRVNGNWRIPGRARLCPDYEDYH